MITVTDRFLHYVSFETTSEDSSVSCPSSPGQRLLGRELVEEMLQMGIADAHMDEYGYVYGSIPGDPDMPTIGLIAHMDTSADASGRNIRPKIVSYNGGDILLNEEKSIILSPEEYPSLKNHAGKHLIVTDGTTLLGADDKAGIAEILTAAQYLLNNGGKHAALKIAFTPDEEIGRGTEHFNLEDFGADYAYTADGGTIGEIEYENFNAASAEVIITGKSIHPGSAKNKMLNSINIAMEFHSLLPFQMRPEYTEGYEGFYHLNQITGSVEETRLKYILRDHDAEKLERQKQIMISAEEFLNRKYGKQIVSVRIQDSYRNMKECILPHIQIIDRAKASMAAVGMSPKEVAIRGGTDGASLSYRGLPCPNLCTGGENYHGRFEYIPVEDMEKCVEMLVHILYHC